MNSVCPNCKHCILIIRFVFTAITPTGKVSLENEPVCDSCFGKPYKDASYRTYYSFFTYIATEIKLDNLELRIPPDMYFGSDDEKAITKSIQDAFPSATRRLCNKHLNDNFNHYMQDKIGIDTKERQHLMNVVFGQNGLSNADTTLMFEERSTKVIEEMKEYPALCQYYEKQMKPRIHMNPVATRKNSINHYGPTTILRLQITSSRGL